MKRFSLVLVLALVTFFGGREAGLFPHSADRTPPPVVQGDEALRTAFENHARDVQVRGSGEVFKILSDDNEGSRHQRFLLRTDSGQTVLVAHNIDLADRIDTLKVGDQVEFFGEYVWNNKGGVIHWTHHDPRGKHVGGWLKHQGRIYE